MGMKSFLLCAVFAALFVLPYTMRVSPDTQFYTHASQTIGGGMRYMDHNVDRWQVSYPPGDYFVAWTPLYPVLLAVGQALLPLPALYKLINGLSLAGIFWVINRQPHPLPVRFAVMLFVPFALTSVLDRALADVLFIFLCIWFLDAVERRQSLPFLILLAIAASLTKYVGVAVIVAGFLTLLLRRDYRGAGVFVLLASVPLGLWLLRNLLLTDTLMGVRLAATIPLMTTLERTLPIVLSWVLQLTLYAGVPYVLVYLLRRVRRRYAVQHTLSPTRPLVDEQRAFTHALAGGFTTVRSETDLNA